ncbi:MAG: methyl-accepting chemotaxis protein [Nitrospiraceae bacterium]|nr:methyl-accepting chemotaxis protein [Nitrospiraceae bacterium]
MSLIDWATSLFSRRKAPSDGTVSGGAVTGADALLPAPGVEIFTEWNPALQRMAEDLESLARDTESEFIAVGDKLQHFSSRFSENSSSLSKIVGILEGGSGLDVGSFKTLFETAYSEIENCIVSISRGMTDMNSLASRINAILDLRVYLKDLSRSISILGIYIRIETARLGDSEFNTMTEVVDELARQIVGETEDIASAAEETNANLATIMNRMAESLGKFEEDLAMAKQRVSGILDDMERMLGQAGFVCARMEGRSSQIMPEIGEVVSALQYHDICRQQMEHVGEALQDVRDKSSRLGGPEVGPEVCPNKGERDSLGRWICDALSIQIHQLRKIVGTIADAADGISSHLTTISDLGEAQVEDISTMLEGEGSGGHRIEQISDEMKGLSAILHDVKTVNMSMIDSISGLNTNVGRMSTQVARIEEISDSINLLALNAIIKVARTGDAGRGLGVLADEIRKLSVTAKEEISKGAGCIRTILAGSTDLKDSLSGDLKVQVRTTEEVGRRTSAAVEQLLEKDREIMGALSQIAGISKTLEGDISALVSGIRFNDIIRTKAEVIISELQSMLDAAAEKGMVPGAEPSSAAGDGLHELAKRYTMESEREIHEAVLAGGVRGSPVPSARLEAGGQEEEELGDNVELF